jgi:hypothetical protein
VYTTDPAAGKVSVVDGSTNKEIVTQSDLPYFTKLTALADTMIIAIVVPGVFITLWHFRKSYLSPIRKTFSDTYHAIKFSESTRLKSFLNYILSGWVWLSSGPVLTILALIVLPLIVVLSQVHYNQMNLFFSENSQYKGLEYERTATAYINYIIQGIFIVSLFFYPPFPAPYSSEKYFKRRGFQAAVIDYEYVKKILYIAVPLFIFLTIIPNIQYEIQTVLRNYSVPINLKVELQQPAYKLMQAVTFFIVLAGLLKIIFALARKKFRLYFAMGCFEIVKNAKPGKKDEVQKMSYVIKGLHSYNLYLRRYLNLEINNIKSLYSKMSRAPIDQNRKVIDRISEIFIYSCLENDTLEPIRYLYKFSKGVPMEEKESIPTEEKESIPTEEFLTSQPIFNKVKDLAAFAAVIIPLAISMIDFYLTKISK